MGGLKSVAAFVVLMTVAAGGWLAVRAGRNAASSSGTVVAAHTLPAVRRHADPFTRWTITEQFSAHSVMVVQVETRHLDDALAIAREIVTPIESRYAEILVYFHRPGRPDTLPPRRVQWSPARGFVDTVLETP